MLLKDKINFNSRGLRHGIVTQAVILLEGREKALTSEKEIYTIISFMDRITEDGIIEKCNEDNRDLMVYYNEEVDPAFLELMHINEEARHFYDEVFVDVMEYCDRVASEQNSFYGLFTTIMDLLGTLDMEQIKEVAAQTGDTIKAAHAKRDEQIAREQREYSRKINEKQEEINSSIKELMGKYGIVEEDAQ